MWSLPEFTAAEWILAVVAALCIGLAKAGLGGIGLLNILIMALILPARESTGVVLPMLIFADVFAVFIYRTHAKWKHVWAPMIPAVAGVVAGYFLMPMIPDSTFRPLIGWIVLVMVILQALNRWRPLWTEHLPHSTGFSWIMGGLTGVATMLANAAGPIMTLYLLARRLPKMEFVGTGAVFFLVINIIKVPFSYSLGLIHGSSVTLNIVLLPAIILGVLGGKIVVRRLPQRVFEVVILAFAAAAALSLIL
jgi:uncharacterized membrane protein YfcA